MKTSSAVTDGLLRFYDRVSANDVDSFDDVVIVDEPTLVIGTAPGEFVRERQRLEFGFKTEGYGLEPGPDRRGYEEGSLGWAVDEPTLNMPDGSAIKTRVTAVLRRDDGTWKLVHAHFSVGVPDEEVVELQKRWGP